jgi:hypothetical protein
MPTEEGKNPDLPPTGEATNAPTTDTAKDSLLSESPDTLVKMIRELRTENANRRRELDPLKKKFGEMEAAQQKAVEDALAEQGKWKDLAEKRAAELAAAKTTADEMSRYRDTLEAMLRRRIESVPETLRKRIPEFGDAIKTLEWLDANSDLLSESRTPPPLDGHAGSNGGAGKANLAQILSSKRIGGI